MNGVNILATVPHTEYVWPDWIFTVLFAIIIIGFVATLICASYDSPAVGIIFAIISLVSLVIIIIGTTITKPAPNTYKVTVENSVSMSEFYEKYDIINQEGKIFEIKEKSLD